MDTRVNIDLDSRWSWVVAFGSCWVNFCIYGLWRSYGILYVGFMENYNVNHQKASLPFTYCCAVYHLIGPIVGILSHKFSIRNLQFLGCILAALGVGMVKLSTNFGMVIIGVGIIQGLGLGIIRTLSNVVIQNFFYKYRATATGISMCGGTISSFFFPMLAHNLLSNYGIENSFLVFSIIILLACFGVIVQREPKFQCNTIDINDTLANIEKLTSINQHESEKCDEKMKKDNLKSEICSYIKNYDIIETKKLCSTNFENSKFNLDKIEKSNDSKKKVFHKNKYQGNAISNLIYVFKKPMFYVICWTFVTYNICLQVFLMSIVDMTKKFDFFTNDIGIKLISLFSLADLIGRIFFGWISDRNYVSPKNIATFCELTILTSFIVLPNLSTLLSIQIVTVITGLVIGVLTILWPLLNVDYFGTDKLAILLGLNCFFSGFESLLRPFLIGFYLDKLNSYPLLFYNIAFFIGITTILWLLEPLLNKKKK